MHTVLINRTEMNCRLRGWREPASGDPGAEDGLLPACRTSNVGGLDLCWRVTPQRQMIEFDNLRITGDTGSGIQGAYHTLYDRRGEHLYSVVYGRFEPWARKFRAIPYIQWCAGSTVFPMSQRLRTVQGGDYFACCGFNAAGIVERPPTRLAELS